jgi:hypothetical protein
MEAEFRERRTLQESRPGLVIRRLLRARAEWKRKCRETKDALQAQRVRIRDLEASRDHWREVAEQAQREQARWLAELGEGQRVAADQAAGAQKKVRAKSS